MGTEGLLEGDSSLQRRPVLFTIRYARPAVSITKITTIPLFFHHDFRVLEHALGVWARDLLILHLGRLEGSVVIWRTLFYCILNSLDTNPD